MLDANDCTNDRFTTIPHSKAPVPMNIFEYTPLIAELPTFSVPLAPPQSLIAKSREYELAPSAGESNSQPVTQGLQYHQPALYPSGTPIDTLMASSVAMPSSRGKRKRKRYADEEEVPNELWECILCSVKAHMTPLKRRGADGKRNLCNACYVRLRVRKERSERGISRPIMPVGGYPTYMQRQRPTELNTSNYMPPAHHQLAKQTSSPYSAKASQKVEPASASTSVLEVATSQIEDYYHHDGGYQYGGHSYPPLSHQGYWEGHAHQAYENQVYYVQQQGYEAQQGEQQ